MLLSAAFGSDRDVQLRETRERVRKLEKDISQRMDHGDAFDPQGRARGRPGGGVGADDIEATTRALVECHAQMLRKRPRDWLEIVGGMERAMGVFRARCPAERWTAQLESAHAALEGRLDFLRIKLRAIEGYAHTTMERLNIQRTALASLMAHRESLVNLQMVAMITDQRRIAQASKRDGNAVKRLSMLAAFFFPGSFLASLFSMVFFQVSSSGLTVLPQLWIYFAATVPLTLAVVAFLLLWDRKRERRVKRQAKLLEGGLEIMEREIALQVRRPAPAAKLSVKDSDDEWE
jgi:Mg2+ and Co2+ transporter CorA